MRDETTFLKNYVSEEKIVGWENQKKNHRAFKTC